MNTPEQVRELFAFIESEFDVSKLCYSGIYFWPVLRSEIENNLCLNISVSKYQPLNISNPSTNFFVNSFRNVKTYFLKRKFENSISQLSSPYLVCAYPNELYTDTVEGKKYSRYIDPYYEVISKHYKIELISFTSNASQNIDTLNKIKYVVLDSFNNYNFYRSTYKLNQNLSTEVESTLFNYFDEINELTFKKYKIKPLEKGMISKVREVVTYKLLTDVFLNKNQQLKALFVECFYDPLKMALVASANQSQIKTIEIQHGGAEDSVYVPYGNNINYQLLPQYLWCWSESDKKLIKNHNANFGFLKPFVAGNMWLKKFVKNEIVLTNENADGFFNEISKKYSSIILVSLQKGIDVSDILERTISLLGNEYFFLIRFHPYSDEIEKNSILKKIEKFKNIEFNISTTLNLYSIFKKCNYQITHSSTTAMEGLSFNVSTIVCSEFGYGYYKDQIKDGVMFYALNEHEIFNIINSSLSINKDNINKYLIQTDTESAYKNLSEILG